MPSDINAYQNYPTYVALNLANGATTSDALPMTGVSLGGIEIPTSFTGTSVSFQVSIDGTNYRGLYDKNGNLVSIPTATKPGVYALDPTIFYPFRSVKIVSSGTEAAARVINCALVLI